MGGSRSISRSGVSTTLALGVLLSGCALLQPERLEPSRETSVVRSAPWGKVYRGGYVLVLSVSGYEPSFRNQREVAVPPGDQHGVFSVSLCPDDAYKRCYALTTIEVAFSTEPGRSYVVKAKEKVTGRNEFWVWVEDQDSRAVVGGAAPEG